MTTFEQPLINLWNGKLWILFFLGITLFIAYQYRKKGGSKNG